ncbi:MATE family efflux transporter [Zophobihabitans entericus]|uniref:Multidrug-efflux transporter n=1 Tax=Zophobihabitans entericus TaxID=1635327 RepID=A0A6G9ICQ1_9GAMM|nr:MATE family efflux transporter [Zophobihabitans entericus]QIQ21360.1 MATE family efflux transporter [Zophobihabitans entericus]
MIIKPEHRKEIKVIITLAIPVIIAQASQTAITFVNTMLAGHYSALALAGVAIGASIWLPTILFGQGLFSVLTPIIANLNGASKRQHIAAHTRQGIVLATFLSAIIMTILYNGDKLINLRSENSPIDPEMIKAATDYLRTIMWGAPGFLYFLVYRNQCEGLSNTKPAMIVAFTALMVNIPINYVLIYGKLGLPELGAAGCGIAAATVFWLMFILMRCYTLFSGSLRDIRNTPKGKLLDFEVMKRIIVLGMPLALAYFFEISLFAIVAILIAPLGEVAVAGHQIIFTISSMTFVIPLALSVATSIRVGFLLGEQKILAAKHTSYISLSIALCMALIMASGLIIFNPYLIAMFTDDIAVILLATQLIILLALYQCSDYLQVTANSVLRGYKDTRSIFIVTFIAYWIIGLPLGYILALTDILVSPMGPAGFWTGIICGLTVAAIFLLSRMVFIQHQPEAQILQRASR